MNVVIIGLVNMRLHMVHLSLFFFLHSLRNICGILSPLIDLFSNMVVWVMSLFHLLPLVSNLSDWRVIVRACVWPIYIIYFPSCTILEIRMELKFISFHALNLMWMVWLLARTPLHLKFPPFGSKTQISCSIHSQLCHGGNGEYLSVIFLVLWGNTIVYWVLFDFHLVFLCLIFSRYHRWAIRQAYWASIIAPSLYVDSLVCCGCEKRF